MHHKNKHHKFKHHLLRKKGGSIMENVRRTISRPIERTLQTALNIDTSKMAPVMNLANYVKPNPVAITSGFQQVASHLPRPKFSINKGKKKVMVSF